MKYLLLTFSLVITSLSSLVSQNQCIDGNFDIHVNTTTNLTVDTKDGKVIIGGSNVKVSTDNGRSFKEVSIASLTQVEMADANIGYAISNYPVSGLVKTTDGGATWILQNVPSIYATSALSNIFTVDANTAYAVGNSVSTTTGSPLNQNYVTVNTVPLSVPVPSGIYSPGTYLNVPITLGTGSVTGSSSAITALARATVVINAAGGVQSVTVTNPGTNKYYVGQPLYFVGSELFRVSSVATTLPISTGNVGNLIDNNAATTLSFVSGSNYVNQTIFEVTPASPYPISGIEVELNTTTNFFLGTYASNSIYVQGWNGVAWVNLNTNVFSAPSVSNNRMTFTATTNGVVYQKYRLFGKNVADPGAPVINTNGLGTFTVNSNAIRDVRLVNTGVAFRQFLTVTGITSPIAAPQGQNFIILKTTNGGATWVDLFKTYGTPAGINPNSSLTVNDLQFFDGDYGYIVAFQSGNPIDGFGGKVLKTTDGGVTWSVSTLTNIFDANQNTQTFNIRAIDFYDRDNGYVAGVGQGGVIYKTSDGGATWQILPLLNSPNGTVFYNAIKATPSGLVFYVQSGDMFKYHNVPFIANDVNYTLGNLNSGVYEQLTVTTADGCRSNVLAPAVGSDTNTPIITVTAVKSPTACDLNDGSFIISGMIKLYQYSLTYKKDGVDQLPLAITTDVSGSYTLGNLDNGDYTDIKVTNLNVISNAVAATLKDPNAPEITLEAITNPSGCALTNGSIRIGGLISGQNYVLNYTLNGTAVAPLNFTANGSTFTISNLRGASYTKIFVVNGGCKSNFVSAVLAPFNNLTSISLGVVTQPSTCNNSNGSFQILGLSNGIAYTISYTDQSGFNQSTTVTPVAGIATVTGLLAGTYTNIYASLNGCVTNSIGPVVLFVGINTNLTITDFRNPTACGKNDGFITITGLVPTQSYFVQLDKDGTSQSGFSSITGVSTFTFSNLTKGTYTNIRADIGFCQSNRLNLVLSEPGAVAINATTLNSSTPISGNGAINISGLVPGQAYVINYLTKVLDVTSAAIADMEFEGSEGYAVGSNSSIWRSTDDGCTWQQLDGTNLSSGFNQIFYLKESNLTNCSTDARGNVLGWAASTGGYIYKTTDGGSSWNAIQAAPSFVTFYSVRFSDAKNGVAVGAFNSEGFIYFTQDGGLTWTQATGYPIAQGPFIAVEYSDPNTVWVVSNFTLLIKSTDGGKTWTNIPITSPTFTPAANAPSPNNVGFLNVFFSDAKTGWISTTRSRIYKTIDGGATWTQTTVGFTIPYQFNATNAANINEIWFEPTGRIGYVISYIAGRAAKSIDGGATWTEFTNIPHIIVGTRPVEIQDMAWIDENIGILVGTRGAIYSTTDGGLNWSLYCSPDAANFLDAVDYSLGSSKHCPVITFGSVNLISGVSGMLFSTPLSGIFDFADEPISCHNKINLTVDDNCGAKLTPDQLLAAPLTGPASFYFVEVKDPNGKVICTNDVSQYLNKELTFSVGIPCGNYCWGKILVEDKTPPVIVCNAGRDLNCYDVDAILAEKNPNTATDRPVWTDGCDVVTAVFTTHKFVDGCNGGFLLRKWIVTDGSGNTAACDQIFNVLTNVAWTCPVDLVELSCKDDVSPEAIAAARGVTSAYPYFTRGNVNIPVQGVCEYYTTYSDQVIDACGPHCHGNKKVIRTWTVLDWCQGIVSKCTQVIKAIDTVAPTFSVKDTIVSTRPWDCSADLVLPPVWELHDNCDIAPTYTVKSSTPGISVIKVGNQWRAFGVPCGVYEFKYTAIDCCGNESAHQVISVNVQDRTAPVPVAKRDLVIGLTPGYQVGFDTIPDAQAKLFAEDVDNGSHDNCSDIRLEIRRASTAPNCGSIGLNGTHNNNRTFSHKFPVGFPQPNAGEYSPQDDDEGKYVKFCCEDLDAVLVDVNEDGVLDTGYHQVILRVWDDGNKDGCVGCYITPTTNNPTPHQDNYNDTWSFIKVECKVPPVISCPADATIFCDWAIETNPQQGTSGQAISSAKSIDGVDFVKTGLPQAYGACFYPAISYWDKLELNQCKQGWIRRTFIIREKGNTRTCVQNIRVNESLLERDWIVTPPNANIEKITACDGPTAAQIAQFEPTWVAGPCDVIGISHKVWQFDFEDGVCRKWKVEYKLVNWCDNDERGPYYKYFVREDTKAPEITCRDTMYAQGADCKLKGLSFSKTAIDEGGCINEGWMKWEVYIDLWADGSNDYLFSSFEAPGTNGAVRLINGDQVKVYYVAPTINGGKVTVKLPDSEIIEGKMSNHKIVWKVADGCHNFASCHENFMVVDKKPPTPYCVSLSTALMEVPAGSTGLPMVELWARDFDKGSFDGDVNWPCTPQEDLLFTFENWYPQTNDTIISNQLVNIDVEHYFELTATGRKAYLITNNSAKVRYLNGELQRWLPAAKSSAKVWTSVSLGGQTSNNVDVKMTVWDKKFNHDFCWVSLHLICNGNGCPGINDGSKIAGKVKTEAGQGVRNVEISASSDLPEYPKSQMTDENGNYEMDIYVDTELSAHKDGDHANGVSTLDLVMIQRHILEIQPLTSPYKLIAADANGDGKITASDLTDIRKLVLGITSEFPKNVSWKFPIANQTMDMSNPFNCLESMVAHPGDTNANYDFIAVKIGDVNGNASTDISNPMVEARNSTDIVLTIDEQTTIAGEIIEIPVTSANFKDVFGYQFTMNLKGADFVAVQAGLLDVNNNNIGVISNSVITMSYASKEGINANEDEILFTLVLKVAKSTQISDLLTVNSFVTKAESYSTDYKVGKISLDVRTLPITNIELYQNEPNPFRGLTTVSFNMPKAAFATLSIYDVTGKLVTVRNIDAVKGLNSEIFNREQLGSSGILYYTLESGDYSATKKMIIVE